MLYLIGTGIWDEMDMSLRAVECAKKCERVYAEFYTTKNGTDAKKLSKLIGKDVVEVQRKDLEENCARMVEEARYNDVAILVGGDCLAATTHSALILEAIKRKIPYSVIHGSSVFTAVSECGLFLYKFGNTTTLPFWSDRYKPTSTYETIAENTRRGLHTLVLLDIGSSPMEIGTAFTILIDMEKRSSENINIGEKNIVVLSRIGSSEQKVTYGKLCDLAEHRELLGKPPFVIVFPGRLHFIEEEMLVNFKLKK
ncbi:MAG: diphthine synthase [Candidatus Micrarchaeia archaeon]